MVVGLIIIGILLASICVVLWMATNGDAWWFALMCAALYLTSVIRALSVRAKQRPRHKTCVDCKYHDKRNCWCNLHGFNKDFLGEPCEKFKLKGGNEDEQKGSR